MKSHIYIEGGESKEDQVRCREGFRRLLEKAGFQGRLPRLSACGSRNSAFDDFRTAWASNRGSGYVGLLVDSEEPVPDVEKPWEHLKARDNWQKPDEADDVQALLMTTCMETWVVADPVSLQKHYGQRLQPNALPPAHNLEQRDRHEVCDKLMRATRNCSNAYAKGKRSFEVLGKLNVAVLQALPSFARIKRILSERL